MDKYYVNKQPQENGDHEVHDANCLRLPRAVNLQYLGEFSYCAAAVIESKQYFSQSNGCYYCSRICHTK